MANSLDFWLVILYIVVNLSYLLSVTKVKKKWLQNYIKK